MCDVKGAMLCLLSSVDRRDGGRNRPGSRRGRGKGGGCDREVQVVERRGTSKDDIVSIDANRNSLTGNRVLERDVVDEAKKGE
jgi:hypothetical protein